MKQTPIALVRDDRERHAPVSLGGSYHTHHLQDCTAVQMKQFASVRDQMGYDPRQDGELEAWLKKEGWKELKKYRDGFRAMVCVQCSYMTVMNPSKP
jgi:hypothetical protein